ncbi:hypothetical protein [Paenibacillus oryzisoli]|uniref:Uncharacterized protein n=1 Tax=Paenibacillus oryzisoli TaxID=1850517 RepID=A0A198A0V7_9BACL|nr:hypothetical protein [Paenibacillus oryzisoli]OAS15094.1 hypothetical protein A8708_22465 [Paenibacillus oryzisoli]
MATVSVVSIFTRGARSSDTPEMRRARVQGDIDRATEAWGSGFFPGVRANINFVSFREYYISDVTIVANTVSSVNDARVQSLIMQARTVNNNATAMYVVYLSGPSLSSGAVGNGGPQTTFFNSATNYGLYGQVVLTDNASDSYLLAHEAGHVLFGRFTSNSSNSFTINDPSNPGNDHNDNPQNLMNGFVPSSNPFINEAQGNVAIQSKLILENNFSGMAPVSISASASGSLASGQYPIKCEKVPACPCCDRPKPIHESEKVKKINKEITKLIKEIGPDNLNLKFKPRTDPYRKCKCKCKDHD